MEVFPYPGIYTQDTSPKFLHLFKIFKGIRPIEKTKLKKNDLFFLFIAINLQNKMSMWQNRFLIVFFIYLGSFRMKIHWQSLWYLWILFLYDIISASAFRNSHKWVSLISNSIKQAKVLLFGWIICDKLLSQFEFLNFSRHGLRKMIYNIYIMWHLEVSYLTTTKMFNVSPCQILSILCSSYGSTSNLPHPRIWDAKNMTLHYFWMSVQKVFNFLGINVFTAANNEILEAPYDSTITIFLQNKLISKGVW